ncbi:sulfatase family protein [Microvirga zambiensis]|uniref:sulfatase family protein n=1 Tax=Microvirga zambiensis TaxID=1402137 RepID=UPI00191E37C4|nr:sulfatase-like hydrolase/transferase [Microvirga zambiensis]
MTRPNILWICTDQQRWDTLGCYGNSFVRTPNLDRLADRGVLFEQAFCQSPVCTPSRASILTGRYPRTTRTRQNGQDIPEDEVLVTKLLADAGYICGLAGKLHLSACHPSVTPGMERRIDDGYAEFHWSHHPAIAYAKQKTNHNWPTNEYNLWLLEQGTEYDPKPFGESGHVEIGPPVEHHHTTWCAEKAETFIEANAGGKRPWLFSVNFYDPHHPFDPPLDYLQRYLDRLDEIPVPAYVPGELDGKPVYQTIDHEKAYGGHAGYPFDQMKDKDHRLVTAAYWAMCDLIDDQVGRLIDALERTGQLDNTIVIFMSDHGEMLGDHGIYLKGPYFYEPAVHVPLIIAGSKDLIRQGERVATLTELTDIAGTLLDAAGIERHPGMQGRTLWPLIARRNASPGPLGPRDDVYCEYYNAMPWHKGPAPQATMVRTERYKLVAFHGEPLGELYDLEADPGETINLWNDERSASVKLYMLQKLCDRMAWTVDPLPLRRAPW